MLPDDDFASPSRLQRRHDDAKFDLETAKAVSFSLRKNARKAILSRVNMTGILPVNEAYAEIARQVGHILECSPQRDTFQEAAPGCPRLPKESIWLEAKK